MLPPHTTTESDLVALPMIRVQNGPRPVARAPQLSVERQIDVLVVDKLLERSPPTFTTEPAGFDAPKGHAWRQWGWGVDADSTGNESVGDAVRTLHISGVKISMKAIGRIVC